MTTKLAKPPARIQRWSLRLSSYDFIVEHKPGLGNKADFLLRLPMSAFKEDVDETEDYINSIIHYSLPKYVSKQKILEKTLIDPVLIKLKEAIKKNKIEKDELQPFSRVFNEFTLTTEGLILLDNQLLIPTSLQNEKIQIAHEGHLGITKTKQLLRSKVWFPNKDIQVETLIKQCIACQATNVKTHRAPLIRSPMPSAPWEEISID